ncbi:cell surface antigen-like Sca8 domain protein [Rickettsia endosymbiont of Ixodes pacificus]|nr:cell surface antigen-like Sca8 domain protein [Rickettsia endosymbiont of Ixodes pacificus]
MLSSAAVAAGDEDERVLDKGWIAGTYVNTQKGLGGYKGHV